MCAVGSPTKTLTYESTANYNVAENPHTFSAQGIGAASSDRRVIVGFSWFGAQTLSSATIGGVSAAITVQGATASGGGAIIIATVPTGTTADIVLTMSGAVARWGITVWSAVGMSTNTATDTGSSSADPGTDTLVSVAGGFLICAAGSQHIAGAGSVSWANATERTDVDIDANLLFSGADAATAGGNVSPSADYTPSITTAMAVFATW